MLWEGVIAVPHDARPARVDDPIDAALRAPHPAILVAWSLAFVAFLSLLAAAERIQSSDASAADVAAAVLLVLMGGASALAFLTRSRLRTMPAAIAGMVVLDLAPPILQATSLSPGDARVRVALLILPTMVGAASLTRHFFSGQLVAALGLAAGMLVVTSDPRGIAGRAIEVAIVLSVLIAGSVMVRRVSATTARHITELRRLALTDKLTGVLNRRGLADGFADMRNSARPGDPIGVLSLDIDHFKWFNDTYGHAAGDDILKLVCQVLQEVSGPDCLVARTGGEELVTLVHGPAEPVADAFRAALAATSEPRVTVSIGIVDAPPDACVGLNALWQILDAADKAMYRAKTTGRDRICRGAIDRSHQARPHLAPAPQHAAVEQPEVETASTAGPLPGWILAACGVLGIVAGALGYAGTSAGFVGQFYMTIMAMCLIVGVIVIGMGPLVDRFRWGVGVVGSDLAILIVAADIDGAAGRMVVVLPTLLTGLMVAQHFGRRLLAAHHAAIVAICMTAPAYSVTPTIVILAFCTAAILIGSTELIFLLQARSRTASADLHRWSVTDPLTGLANRHGLELGFETLSRAEQLTVLALDVDDFKGINDTCGHAAGDDALIRLAVALRTVTSPDTVVCRTGGDEFVVLAPSMRPSALTSKVKRAAALLPLPLSVSIGSAVAAPHRLRTLWQLVDAADAALIRAKRSRRQQRQVTRPDDAPRPSGSESIENAVAPGVSGPSVEERAELDERDFGIGQSLYLADALVIDSDDGSSAETSTRTTSPSTNDPDKSWRAS